LYRKIRRNFGCNSKFLFDFIWKWFLNGLCSSTELCPWEADSNSATQEVPRHSLPSSQESATGPNLEATDSNTHPLKLSSEVLLLLTSHRHLGLPSDVFPAGFPTKTIYSISYLPRAGYMPRPSSPPWFDHPNNTSWSVQIMKLLIMQFYPPSCHFITLRSKYSPQYLRFKAY
jgi:hypothetical protein